MIRNVPSGTNLGILAPIATQDGIIRLESTTRTRRNSIDGGSDGRVTDGDMSDGSQMKQVDTFTETDFGRSVVTGRATTNIIKAMMPIAYDTGDLESKIDETIKGYRLTTKNSDCLPTEMAFGFFFCFCLFFRWLLSIRYCVHIFCCFFHVKKQNLFKLLGLMQKMSSKCI